MPWCISLKYDILCYIFSSTYLIYLQSYVLDPFDLYKQNQIRPYWIECVSSNIVMFYEACPILLQAIISSL